MIEQKEGQAILVCYGSAPGTKNLEIRITLFSYSPLIEIVIRYKKLADQAPESLYLAFPLNLPSGWKSHFNTAGIPTELNAVLLISWTILGYANNLTFGT